MPVLLLSVSACSDDEKGSASGGGTGGVLFSLPDAGSDPIAVPPPSAFEMGQFRGYALGDPVTARSFPICADPDHQKRAPAPASPRSAAARTW
jgi:hypothetical protein